MPKTRLDQYETLLGQKAIIGLEQKAERRASKANKGKLALAKRKTVKSFRMGREKTALSGGRDALALIGGGDVTRRKTLLSRQSRLSNEQKMRIIGDDFKDELKDIDREIVARLTSGAARKRAQQEVEAARQRGEHLTEREVMLRDIRARA